MIRIRHMWFASLLALATTAATIADDSIPWVTDLAQARRMAEQQQRPVLLHFYGDGCPPCQQLEANVFNQPELIRVLSTNFVCVKIHVQQQQNIASYYKIDKIPTDIVVLPSGVQLFRTTSPSNVNAYIAMLDQVRANALANGLQQVDRVANKVQQLMPNLPSLPIRAPDEQAGPQQVNNDGSFQLSSQPTGSQPWRNVSVPAPAEQQQSTMVSNEFVGPLDQAQAEAKQAPATQPEAQPARSAPTSRYDNPYMKSNVAADSTSSPAAGVDATPNNTAGSLSSVPGDKVPGLAPSATETATAEQAAPQNVVNNQGPAPRQNGYGVGLPPSPAVPANPGNFLGASSAPPSNANQSWTPPQTSSALPPAVRPPAEMPVAGAPRPNATNPNLPQLPPNVPPLALDGHCPVTLMNLGKWEKGDPRFGVVHRDRTYLFKSQIERDRFLAPSAADRYAPVLSGFDPVRFAETGQAVDGRREHGVLFDGQIYLFADEEALVRFEQQPHRYVAVVRQAMTNARTAPPQR